MGKSGQTVAAEAANTISVLPLTHRRFQMGLCWNILLAQQGVLPAPFLWAGRQQVNEQALAAWQKQGLGVVFKGKGRNQTQQDKSIGSTSEICSESSIDLDNVLFHISI